MQILIIHQSFPGQFRALAPALARDPNNRVIGLTITPAEQIGGVEIVKYAPKRNTSSEIHHWLVDFETKVIRAEAAFHACLELKKSGFEPDIVISHHGWGESLFIKEVWPNSRLGIYCELYYHSAGFDACFDPEFCSYKEDDPCRIKMKNINNDLHFSIADRGISPTFWQKSSFPPFFQSKIDVIHDGVPTNIIAPNPNISITIKSDIVLSKNDQVITFVNRNLEPYRGFHIFMRALPSILNQNKQARVIIVGNDDVGYGGRSKDGRTWREIFLSEVIDKIDVSRVHFVGPVNYDMFIGILQLSTVHVYFTYPFVLSWSLIEAMSAGCAIVASDTGPVREVITHNETGILVDFFDYAALAYEVSKLLNDKPKRERLGYNARSLAVKQYDLETVCLPRQIEWVNKLGNKK